MRDGGYNPRAGNPVPIELVYQCNTITREEYKIEVERQRRVAQALKNGEAIDDMEAEAEALNQRAIRAGVPKRYLQYAIDLRHIEDLKGGSGIYICGVQGSHKTTIGTSMLRGWLKDNPFGIAKFIRATTLMDDFKETFGTRDSEAGVMRQYASVGLLLIDDLGKEVASNWAVSKLWELIDRRYGELMPTIVTTQHRPDDLISHLGEGDTEAALAIASRFRETYIMLDMGDTDYR